MATQGAAAAPAGQPAAQGGSPQQLNQIVMEYLSKKGYTQTEAMLRVESMNTDSEGRPILKDVEHHPAYRYEKSYSDLKRWIDNSLDIYKPELRRVLFPVFIHSYLWMVSEGFKDPAIKFWQAHEHEHKAIHHHDLQQLESVTLPHHVEENQLAQLYLKNKYRLVMTQAAVDLIVRYLEDTRSHAKDIINSHVDLKTIGGRAGTFAARGDEDVLGDDEGLPGHTPGRTDINGSPQKVKLGPLPMDRDMISDVEEELKEEDAKMTDPDGGTSLIDEFRKIKREESEDSPMNGSLPLPPYTAVDVDQQVKIVKQSRDAIKLKGPPGPALPSVAMYTFHNTFDGLHCVDFSDDMSLVAGGFAESYVHVWSMDGTPLKSAIASENLPSIPKSRRLVGHSGPVYGVSFSPDRKYLLSSSEDKTVRLWSMDTYTGMVVYRGHDAPVWDVKFGPFGHYFATAGHDHTARLWSCDHIYPLRIFAGHVSDVDTVTFHPNSSYVFTGSSDKTVRMWDIQSGNSVRVFSGHTAPVTTLAVSPNGQWFASAGEDSMINIWDIASGKRLKTMRGHGRTSIYSLAFSAEGNVLVSGGADMTVRCWDTAHGTGAETAELPEAFGTGASGAADGSAKIDGVSSTAGKPRKGKDIMATPDQLAVWNTKKSPVYKVKFDRKNQVLAASAFLP